MIFKKSERISIISPCFNGESYISPHIESILSQTYDNLEYIFVNDGSTDLTEKNLFLYKNKFKEKNIRFIYLKQNENKGQASAINLGLQKMTGKYFSCIDSDDILMPNFASEMSKYLKQNKDVSICFPKAESVEDKTFEHLDYIYRDVTDDVVDTFLDDMLEHFNVPFFPSYMLRTKDFIKIYPNKKIYAGKSGQNPQMILPFAYNQKVGYIDKVLIKRVVRKTSDSTGLTDRELIKKYRNWENLYCQTLKYIPQMLDYEKSYYFAKIKNLFESKRQVVIQRIRAKRDK